MFIIRLSERMDRMEGDENRAGESFTGSKSLRSGQAWALAPTVADIRWCHKPRVSNGRREI